MKINYRKNNNAKDLFVLKINYNFAAQMNLEINKIKE
jgi:hypothetical protein